jgi:signal transduction histidine kinase
MRRLTLARASELRIPRWLRSVLEVPLELKLLGANLIIVGLAVLLMFGPVELQPGRVTDAYVVVAALILGATVNFMLVRLALRPIESLERIAKWISEGRLGERVPASMVADHELTRLSKTINGMLDSLAAGRERMEKLGAEVVYAEERERSQVAQELHDLIGQKLADASFQIGAAANEMESHARASRLADARDLLRTASEEIRNVSRSAHLHVAKDNGFTNAFETQSAATLQRSLASARSTFNIPRATISDRRGVVVLQDIRDVGSGIRGGDQR